MIIRKIAAVIVGAVCIFGCASCEKEKKDSSSVSEPISVGENGVGELITPDEDSKEYDLGSYRFAADGVKLYYDENTISAELMLALKKYFMTFQNKDFESYKNCLAFDYAELYNKYLEENYDYSLSDSFELQCSNIRKTMITEITGEYDTDGTEDYSGNFEITRIKAERPELAEGETEEELIKEFFSYLDECFDMDYYSYVAEQADSFEYLTFFIIARGEDDEEYRIISEVDIVFAVKDGEYYTFG